MKREEIRSVPPPDWPERFLKEFRKSGNLSHSARRAHCDRTAVYRRRDSDMAFAAALKEARLDACEALEMEARRRAMIGVLEPVYYKGEKCGVVRKFSDTLLIVLLKAEAPNKYRERSTIDIRNLSTEQIIAALEADAAAGIDPAGSGLSAGDEN